MHDANRQKTYAARGRGGLKNRRVQKLDVQLTRERMGGRYSITNMGPARAETSDGRGRAVFVFLYGSVGTTRG
jgi:hypothetical protein